ncbi:MAG: MarR family winged helix-turn-helix transcriptional regulator [Thermoleophilia bacterium]
MERDVAELIDRLGVVTRASRRRAAAAAGLSPAQLDALAYLAACNRFSDTPAAVALYLDATRGTTSQSLIALERKGLIVRESDREDRRVSHLRPTDAGRALLSSLPPDDLGPAVATLGEDARELGPLLEQVLRSVQRARGGRTFGECGTCRHLRGASGRYRCGLTDEPLRDDETRLRCVEHGPAAA